LGLEAKKMMKKHLLFLTAMSFAGIANSADAAGPDEPPVINASDAAIAEPVAERWGGFYVGLAVGKGFASDTAPAKADGIAYGGFAGYNAQWGHFVAGVDVAADSFNATFDDGQGIKSRYMYAGRIRAGVANDWAFVYGSLGAEHGVTNIPAPFTKDTTLQLGAGVDFAVTKHISLGLDYTHANYKKFADLPLDVTTDKLQARLAYTFN
jgi:outer membrane immunogenic protein